MNSLDDFQAIVKPDEPLAPHTWFRIGGPAQFLAKPRNTEELQALLVRCSRQEIPVRILAAGSNILIREAGVSGVVIHLESPAFSDVTLTDTRMTVGAAVPLTALISQSARAGLAGLEVLTGIPGTVGGAIRGNAGGRQGSIGEHVRRVTVIDGEGQIQVRQRDELSFAHRWSNLDEPVILSADIELRQEDPESVVKRMRRVWILKKENQPYGHQSSGCIFKNPTSDLAAATLLDQSGMKGLRVGGAQVSERHSNYIVTDRGAKSDDVLQLIDVIREKVRAQYGFELELAIQIW